MTIREMLAGGKEKSMGQRTSVVDLAYRRVSSSAVLTADFS